MTEKATRRKFVATASASVLVAPMVRAQTTAPVEALTKRSFNLRTALTPATSVRVGSERDAQVAVRQARQTGRGFALRSGGHCFEGLSQHRETVIDLGGLAHLRWTGTDRISIGPGVRLGDVNGFTGPHNMMLPAGYCQTVGIGGHIGGGGIGLLSRQYGLASDHLVSARVVLADASIVTASAQSHSDLFWALRGGGSGSFGIVTDFSFKLRPVSQAIYVQFFWEFSPETVAPIVAEWQKRAQKLPRGIASVMFLRALGNGLVQARMFLHSISDEETTISAARMMHDIAPPSIAPRISIKPPHDIADEIWPSDYFPVKDTKITSNFQIRPTSASAWLQILSGLAERDDQALAITLDLLGGAVDDAAIEATAFPHRGTAIMTAQFALDYNELSPRKTQLDWMRNLQAISAQDASTAAYINYPDRDLTDYATRYWGPNLEQLKAVKARYDPNNVFRHAQSVPF
jgi:hypothetical protein